ncbi:MarR family transcriptional regulator [Microbispora hainanensis]|jgi:DNA-binding MarR family transcriptional regulator|uniref:MarR family transcriptional regulator n=2 Tax=Microbispora hainanensis TaxID=568844 RepID=A0ABZ1SLB5_9ACTN|nr:MULTISPECIES: MarR family transcriptional regulator [Microbispora]NJP29352.1 MarR family transcriptional regulator [Microbispora sp. CL1-1]TQS05433.1 MarR family transcriptional regulator [Microbispora sp. SCL1-1]
MTTISQAPAASSDQAVWGRVLTLHAQVERQLTQALQRRHGIGLSEFRALECLVQAKDGELRMQELADKVGLGQSSVTRLVGRLFSAGFAVRDVCPDDKRGVYAVIVDAGRQRYAEARGTYSEVLSAALNTAGATPELGSTVQALRGAV